MPITPDNIIQSLCWLVVALGGGLGSVALWIGKQLAIRLGAIEEKLEACNTTLVTIERDLRGDLARLDRRVVKLETTCEERHSPHLYQD